MLLVTLSFIIACINILLKLLYLYFCMRQTVVILEDIPEIPVTTDWNFGRGDSVIFFFLPLFARWNRSFDLLIVLDYTSISHEELHSANRCASCWGKKATSGSSQYINPISSYCIISRFKLQTMRWFEQFVHVG